MSAREIKQAAEKINGKNEGAKHPAPDTDATKAQIIECNFSVNVRDKMSMDGTITNKFFKERIYEINS